VCILEERLLGVHDGYLIFTLHNAMTNPTNSFIDCKVFYLHHVLRLCIDALPLLIQENVPVMLV
jgi:hypothetical protein